MDGTQTAFVLTGVKKSPCNTNDKELSSIVMVECKEIVKP